MPIELSGSEALVASAVAEYWQTIKKQGAKNQGTQGKRGGVTGGKQMDGFCRLIEHVVRQNGLPQGHVYTRSKLELPGYFRATKKWDLLVVHDGVLLASMEFKSQAGPSFGNNGNNRIEEAIGMAHDLATANREMAFGQGQVAPWVGYVFLVEDCPKSNRSIGVKEPHFEVFKEFKGASYIGRYEQLLRRMVAEKLFDGALLLASKPEEGLDGKYSEPASDLNVRRFLAGLAARVSAYLAGK